MFIVNAQTLILKNYSLPTFEKSASMLTGTTDVVPAESKERRARCPSVEICPIFWCVRSLPFSVGTHYVHVTLS